MKKNKLERVAQIKRLEKTGSWVMLGLILGYAGGIVFGNIVSYILGLALTMVYTDLENAKRHQILLLKLEELKCSSK